MKSYLSFCNLYRLTHTHILGCDVKKKVYNNLGVKYTGAYLPFYFDTRYELF